jgi:arylsulfatase A-like enzyme
MLDQLLDESEINRDHFVHQGINTMALISGDWKYIIPKDGPKISQFTNIEMGNDTNPQLYNLKEDIGETKNLAIENPGKLKELEDLLSGIMKNGRTRN